VLTRASVAETLVDAGRRKTILNRPVKSVGVLIAIVLAVLTWVPVAAQAAPAVLTLDTSAPDLVKLDTGGWKTELQCTALLSEPVALSVASKSPPVGRNCTVQFDTGMTASFWRPGRTR
jgi:hypothetical protein